MCTIAIWHYNACVEWMGRDIHKICHGSQWGSKRPFFKNLLEMYISESAIVNASLIMAQGKIRGEKYVWRDHKLPKIFCVL